MPGPVSESYKGPPEDGPYVPSWCYPKGPRMCPCGHHEGFHDDRGGCIRIHECLCSGIPDDCVTPLAEMQDEHSA